MNISGAAGVQAALGKLAEQLQAAMAAQDIGGLSAAVVYDQEIIWTDGFGLANRERNIAATPDTMYRIASITKVFTTTMLMHARDAGLVRLDDAVTKYLPAYQVRSRFRDSPPPTLRQLASHTAGLPPDLPGNNWKAQDFPKDKDEFLARLKDVELALLPGSAFNYSNLGISLLGLALAEAVGQSYEQYLQANILSPLGMRDSGLYIHPIPDRFAIGYVPEDVPFPASPPDVDFAACAPEAQMYSTVRDLARFVALQFRNGDAPAGNEQIIAGSSVREMHTPVMLTPDWRGGIGLGFALGRLDDYSIVRATGGLIGYASNITIIPALKLGVLVLANALADAEGIAADLAASLAPAFAAAITEAEEAIPAPPTWQQYVGFYAYPGHKGVDITIKRGKLVMSSRLSGRVYIYEAVREHRFIGVEGNAAGSALHFALDDKGQVLRAITDQEVFERQ